MLFNLTKVVVFGFYWALRLSVVHCENDGQVVMIWKEGRDGQNRLMANWECLLLSLG